MSTQTSINISLNGTNSFVPSAPIQRTSILDTSNPLFSRYAYMTQDCVTMVFYTASVVVPMSQLYSASIQYNNALTWPPVIITNPTNSAVTHTASVFFTISASAELPITYQWYSQSYSQSLSGSWSSLSNGSFYSGSTTSKLTHSISSLLDFTSSYICVATDAVGSTSSSIAILTVK